MVAEGGGIQWLEVIGDGSAVIEDIDAVAK
jgi:hypothetical protein